MFPQPNAVRWTAHATTGSEHREPMNGSAAGPREPFRPVPVEPMPEPPRISWRAAAMTPVAPATVDPGTVEPAPAEPPVIVPAPHVIAGPALAVDGVPPPWSPVVPRDPALAGYPPPTTPRLTSPVELSPAHGDVPAAPVPHPEPEPGPRVELAPELAAELPAEPAPAAPSAPAAELPAEPEPLPEPEPAPEPEPDPVVRLRLVAGTGPNLAPPPRPSEPPSEPPAAAGGPEPEPPRFAAPDAVLAHLAELAQSACAAASMAWHAGERAVGPLLERVPHPPVPRIAAEMCARVRAAAGGLSGLLGGRRAG